MVGRLNTCCGCGDLRTGTIIIGGLCILGSVLAIVYNLLDEDNPNQLNNHYYGSQDVHVPMSVKITGVLLYLGMVTTSIIMIVGGVKQNWKLIVPWLVLDGIVIGLQMIGFVIIGILFIAYHSIGFMYLGLGLIYTVVSIYLWYVPFSYHLNLKDESQTPVYNTNITNPVAVYTEAPSLPPKYSP